MTLSSVTAAQFYCFYSRYNGHQSATFNILDRITSNYNCLCSCVYTRRRAGPACRDPGCTSRDLGKCDSPPHIHTTKSFTRIQGTSRASPAKRGVTQDDSQRRFLAQQRVAMLEQCCNHSKQCRNNVATLCCVKNRRCESSRVTLP